MQWERDLLPVNLALKSRQIRLYSDEYILSHYGVVDGSSHLKEALTRELMYTLQPVTGDTKRKLRGSSAKKEAEVVRIPGEPQPASVTEDVQNRA